MLRTLPVLYLVGFAAAAAPPTQRTRRQALRYGVGGAATWPLATAALPSDNAGALTTLRRRVGQRTLAQGSYGLDAPDVYYPDFFEGTWRGRRRRSRCRHRAAARPLRRQRVAAAARAELEAAPVVYEARWIRDGRVASSRTVLTTCEHAAATMGGADALQQLPSSDAFDPNGLIFKLKPEGSDVTYRAELRALARRFEPSAGELRDSSGLLVFDAGELSRQSISLPGKELVQPPSVKDIETINLFTLMKNGRITSTQRTSTWLRSARRASRRSRRRPPTAARSTCGTGGGGLRTHPQAHVRVMLRRAWTRRPPTGSNPRSSGVPQPRGTPRGRPSMLPTTSPGSSCACRGRASSSAA